MVRCLEWQCLANAEVPPSGAWYMHFSVYTCQSYFQREFTKVKWAANIKMLTQGVATDKMASTMRNVTTMLGVVDKFISKEYRIIQLYMQTMPVVGNIVSVFLYTMNSDHATLPMYYSSKRATSGSAHKSSSGFVKKRRRRRSMEPLY